MRKVSSEQEVRPAFCRSSSQRVSPTTLPNTSSRNLNSLSYDLALSPGPHSLLQLCCACFASCAVYKRFRGHLRGALIALLWISLEICRLLRFRHVKRLLKKAALRTPVAREGVKSMERRTSNCFHDHIPDDWGGQSVSQISFCQHFLHALQRKHRFDRHLLPHMLRRGLNCYSAADWFAFLFGVISNSGTLSVRSNARTELCSLATACGGGSNDKLGGRDSLECVPWGVTGLDCAWPQPLVIQALLDGARAVLALSLEARGFRPRRVYAKVCNADLEYLLWIHVGPKRHDGVAPAAPPVVFLHGVGTGAPLYGSLLAHLASERRVIAVEVPGTSRGQMAEAGPAAILDGLPAVIRIALGTETKYDIVSHSAGGWWTSVVLRAALRGQLHAPRRVVILESPCFVPACLGIYMQGQGDIRDSLSAPYRDCGGVFGFANRWLGRIIHALFAKDLWNIHTIYLGFTADELVILPDTISSHEETSFLFSFAALDGYTVSEECVAYIKDMLAAPHVHTALLPGLGHGSFLLLQKDWDSVTSVIDEFLNRGLVAS